MPINNQIINQKGTPAFFSDIFANRPAFGYAGRVFISTDTGAIYEDTGTSWTLIADAGAGTTGTLQQVTTNGNTTTLGITIQGIDINDGAGTGTENTAIGKSSLNNNTTGINNTALGSYSLGFNTTGNNNTALGVNSLITNTTGSGNTAIGRSSLNNNTTGGNNVAIGYVSLNSNTTASNNTAIGVNTLSANTTGSLNTAIGYASMLYNSTGASNTGIGVYSLGKNTTGNYNSALGVQSLYNNTTGDSNTAIGYQSLNANTTGSTNTAFGTSALASNTTAGQNTAVGNSSMSANTTGSLNTAVGQGSMQANTTGNYNTALGTSSLNANTTGVANTAIGYQSLNANTTSNNNTAIGYGSLLVNTGAGNTGIGYGSLSSNTSGTNNVAIGNSALIGNTTASSNTAVGTSALTSASTGGQNTAIGISAGVNISTGTNNSFVGINAGIGITTGSNNSILGNAGTLSATLTSNIILADGGGNVRLFSNSAGLIGINQAVGTPSAQLDIHTTATYGLAVNGTGTSNAYLGFANAGTYKWRIGNTYNAGANSFDIFNLGTSANAISISSINNIGISTAPSDWFTVYRAIQIGSYGAAISGQTNDQALSLWNNAYPNASNVETYTTTNTANKFRMESGAFKWFSAPSGTAGTAITFTQPMTLFSTGNLAIGSATDDTTNKLQVTGRSKFNGTISIPSTSYFIGNSTYGFRFNNGADSTTLMTIKDNGNILLGTTTDSGYKLDVRGGQIIFNTDNISTLIMQRTGTDGDSIVFYKNSTQVGSISVTASLTSYNVTSDYRLKQDYKDYKGLELISAIKTYDYQWKLDKSRMYGVIAHELQEVLPYAVTGKKDDEQMQSVDYSKIVPILIKSIQELNEKLVRNNIN